MQNAISTVEFTSSLVVVGNIRISDKQTSSLDGFNSRHVGNQFSTVDLDRNLRPFSVRNWRALVPSPTV